MTNPSATATQSDVTATGESEPDDTSTTVLRDATWRDIATLTRLDAELFENEAWNETTWWEELAARPRREYVIAEQADGPGQEAVDVVAENADAATILGYAGLDVAGSTADVMTIAVTPQARGRGLGRRLLDHLVTAATHAGADALLLEVRADNTAAIGLYDTSGFERLSVRRRYYQPGDVDAVIMRKLLKEAPRA